MDFGTAPFAVLDLKQQNNLTYTVQNCGNLETDLVRIFQRWLQNMNRLLYEIIF